MTLPAWLVTYIHYVPPAAMGRQLQGAAGFADNVDGAKDPVDEYPVQRLKEFDTPMTKSVPKGSFDINVEGDKKKAAEIMVEVELYMNIMKAAVLSRFSSVAATAMAELALTAAALRQPTSEDIAGFHGYHALTADGACCSAHAPLPRLCVARRSRAQASRWRARARWFSLGFRCKRGPPGLDDPGVYEEDLADAADAACGVADEGSGMSDASSKCVHDGPEVAFTGVSVIQETTCKFGS